MKYDFNEVHNRLGTYCTQWDYIQDGIIMILNHLLQDILKEGWKLCATGLRISTGTVWLRS